MFGLIKFLIKTALAIVIIIGVILGYRYYSIYVPYSDFIYQHLYFDELKSIYAGKCASIAYNRALYNKSINEVIDYDDILISPYVSFGKWIEESGRTDIGKEMQRLLPNENWYDFAAANKTTYVKYVNADDTKYKILFVITEPSNAYTEKLEFDGPVSDYYGPASDMVRGWAADAFEIRSKRGPDAPRAEK